MPSLITPSLEGNLTFGLGGSGGSAVLAPAPILPNQYVVAVRKRRPFVGSPFFFVRPTKPTTPVVIARFVAPSATFNSIFAPIPPVAVPVPPVIYADNLLAAIRARLLATPALSAITDVYRRVSPRKPVYPFMILNPINERPEFNASNYSFPAWYLFQAVVFAEEDTQGETLRDSAYSALMPKHSNPPLIFYGGNEIGRFPGIKMEWEQPGTGPRGEKIWAFAFQFEVYVGRLQ